MAIFGDLAELPFPEVLSTLGRKSGALHLYEGLSRYEVHLDNDHLLALFVNGVPVADVLRLRETVLALAQSTTGRFEFHRRAATELHRHHDLSVTRLLLSTTTVIDELAHYRDRLAPPETRFVLHDGHKAEHALDENQRQFLARARPFLVEGASAQELAGQLAMHVEGLQLTLYKLRTAGLLVPMRAFAPPVPDLGRSFTPPPPAAARESPGLVSRLLGALRRRGWFA